ncbi:MAG: flagellar biosynthesis protein [Clostridia bacterium]|nr:flagellar biosynthesis protein [Clostridia bacterium]
MTPQDKVKKVVALRYNDDLDQVPRVVASGKGQIADKIIAKARETGIPVYRDSDLAEMLAGLAIGSAIPVELYQVVAEVLVFIYALDQGAKTRPEQKGG